MLTRTLSILFLTVQFTSTATAQSTNATCLPFYDWMNNSQKQTPCQVASTLLAVCTGSYNIAALPSETHYIGPSLGSANPCQCNTVVYSLISACGACQDRTYESWSEWSGNCATVSEFFPANVQGVTFVPSWAYLDVEAGNTFNQTAAKLVGGVTESTVLPVPTSTKGVSVSSMTLTSPLSASITSSPSGSTADTNPDANAVGGGIAGSIVGLGLVVTFAVWYSYRRSKRRTLLVADLEQVEQSHTSEKPDMLQYLANTTAPHRTSSSILNSLPPSSSQASSASVSRPARSLGHSSI